MKIGKLAIAALATGIWILSLTQTANAQAVTRYKVLLIGNSQYGYQDPPPSAVEPALRDLFQQQGLSAEVSLTSVGGTGCEGYWSYRDNASHWDPFTQLSQGDYNFVVLQPGLGEAAFNTPPDYSCFDRFRTLAQGRGIAFTMLATLHTKANYVSGTDRMNASIGSYANQQGVAHAPAGQIIRSLLGEVPSASRLNEFYETDSAHPSSEARYIYVLAIYRMITGRSTIGLPTQLSGLSIGQAQNANNQPVAISAAEALQYQQAVDAAIGGTTMPSVTLQASPSTVASGATATLTWTSNNATTCTASGDWAGNKTLSGSETTAAINANRTYTLMCSNSSGQSATATANVTVQQPVMPTVTLTATPTTVVSGNAATLTWSTTNAASCTASGSWSGAKATSGTQSTGALTTNSSYSLACTSSTGNTASATATVSVQQAIMPTVILTAAPTSVVSGSAATLTWSTTNAASCTASGGWSGTKATSGMQSTGALTANASYTLACTSSTGNSAIATANVTVTPMQLVPTVTLSATPAIVTSGAGSTIAWSSTNATSCTASGAWSGPTATSGSQSTGTLTANATYTLVCQSSTGQSATASTTINVVAAPTIALTANSTNLASGSSATLTWSATSAASCTASGSWSGAKEISGTQSTGALTANATYTLSCANAAGTNASASVTINVSTNSGSSGQPTRGGGATTPPSLAALLALLLFRNRKFRARRR